MTELESGKLRLPFNNMAAKRSSTVDLFVACGKQGVCELYRRQEKRGQDSQRVGFHRGRGDQEE